MNERFQIEVGGFRLTAELSTTNVDTHSKITDRPEDLEAFKRSIEREVKLLAGFTAAYPKKEVRLAEGCR